MSTPQKIIHVKKHLNSSVVELGEGLLRYPKDGYTSFKNYQVPVDFSLTDEKNITIVCDMYFEGKIISECGTVELFQKDKTKHSKQL